MPEDKKILVRVPNWIGDAVIATGFLAALKKMQPEAAIDILAQQRVADIFQHHPAVAGIIAFDSKESWRKIARRLKGMGYDACYLLPLSFSSALIVWLAGIPQRIGYGSEARGFLLTRSFYYDKTRFRSRHLLEGFLDLLEGAGSAEPAVILDRAGEQWAEHWLAGRIGDKALIGFGPGATYGPAKRWPEDRWIELGRLLARKGQRLLIFGSSLESDLCQRIAQNIGEAARSCAGETDLRQTAALLSKCRLFVSNDTGVMHLAAAVGTRVVALFGSTNPAWTRPWGRGHLVIYLREPCSPCYQRTCRFGHYHCLKAISVETALEAIDKSGQIR